MELKNCPFCGGKAEIYFVTENEKYARCTDCGVRQLLYYKVPENQIIADWNERVEPPAEKPPIGIMPETIWVKQRIVELCEAIIRYSVKYQPDTEIMMKWACELKKRIDQISETEESQCI